jgi:hypothetical protein
MFQFIACCQRASTNVAQVEKAPIVLKAGVKKEEAEELQKKLEAGAMISRQWLVGSFQPAVCCALCEIARCMQGKRLTSIACTCMQWGQRLRSSRQRTVVSQQADVGQTDATAAVWCILHAVPPACHH